jgi:hypothetical protein
MNSSDAPMHEAAPKQSSVIAHPWFPKMIGLWFAALFGLCSLALAPEMLERIVTTLGIERIVPAAAPPLGQTARLLLALGMAAVGEIAGLVVGARLAAKRAPQWVRQRGLNAAAAETEPTEAAPTLRGRDRHPDAPARKPLSATSDLGDDAGRELGGIETALRRRALASETEREPRPFFEAAPLPGEQWPVIDVAGETEPANAGDVSDLRAFDVPPQAHADEPSEPFAADPVLALEPMASFEVAPQVADAVSVAIAPAPAAGIASASLEALGVVQLSERLALALQARRERRAQASLAIAMPAPPGAAPVPNVPVEEPVAAQEQPVVPPVSPPRAPFAVPASFAPVIEHDPDEHDDIPALARSLTLPRLAGSEFAASAELPEPPAPDLERGLEILARRAPKPAVDVEAEIPERETAEPVFAAPGLASADASEGEALDELPDEVLDSGYSSLLAMGAGFQRPEAVRIEEPLTDEIEPVVIFPGQDARCAAEPLKPSPDFSANAPFARPPMAPPAAEVRTAPESAGNADPEETDRALRAALASLQRISGAR